MKLPLDRCKNLIQNADILLFRAPNTIWSIGWWIAKLGGTPYSHVGLACHCHHELVCIEFREFIGSRKLPLKYQFEERPNLEIDVFRVSPQIVSFIYSEKTTWGQVFKPEINISKKEFNPKIAQQICGRAERFIGRPYAWKLIYQIGKTFVPGLRLCILKDIVDINREIFVCSTLVTHSYRMEYVDLCPFIADEFTQPADIAKSSALSYLFTITK